jgi:hypothetical protein
VDAVYQAHARGLLSRDRPGAVVPRADGAPRQAVRAHQGARGHKGKGPITDVKRSAGPSGERDPKLAPNVFQARKAAGACFRCGRLGHRNTDPACPGFNATLVPPTA